MPAKLPPWEAPQRAAVDTMRLQLEAATTAVWHPRHWAISANSFRADSVWLPLVRTTTRKPCCSAATMSISRAKQQQQEELKQSNWQRGRECFGGQMVPNISDLVPCFVLRIVRCDLFLFFLFGNVENVSFYTRPQMVLICLYNNLK